MSSTTLSPTLTGSFTQDAFNAHLATQSSAPVWWLDRKRDAYAKFAALPMPKRTDETWRFSNISTLTLDGFQVGRVVPNAPSNIPTGSGIDGVAALTFINNVLAGSTPLAPELTAKGVIVTTLAAAAQSHPDLLKAHFMAQPQKLGSEKFAALHSAFVGDGAFIYIPKGVELPAPLIITHVAQGAGTAVFPHTLVIAEENAKATIVDLFLSADDHAHFACGSNDLYAAHGAQLTYVGAQNWSRETLSFHFNDTIVRRDARVQSLNVTSAPARPATSRSRNSRPPARFPRCSPSPSPMPRRNSISARCKSTRRRTRSPIFSTRTRCATKPARSSPASSSSIRTRRRPTPTSRTAT